jgi:hypothetical protein
VRTLCVPGRGLYPPPRCGVRRAAAWRPAAGSSPTPRTGTRPTGPEGDISVNNVDRQLGS